jgi:glycosyltransferase involved in cell wall biosynthesis
MVLSDKEELREGNMNELITIIVPIYKVEGLLKRCVDSLLNQTYKNLEIILVNDGSPDQCGNICDEYAKLDNRVIVIHKENGGLSDARNAGIEIAKGDFIAFIDSDDWIHEEYIEILYGLLRKTNSEISMCNFFMTSTENFQVDNAEIKTYKYTNIEALERLYDKFNVQMVTAWGKLYKRELFEGVSFPLGRVHEDEFTTYKIIYKANNIVLTTAQLLYYWQREDSIMGDRYNLKNKLDQIDALKERNKFFNQLGLEELCNKTNRRIFLNYREIYKEKKMFLNKAEKEDFYRQFISFRKQLRESKQSPMFKVFYELYFLAPKSMDILYKIYKNKRWNNIFAR